MINVLRTDSKNKEFVYLTNMLDEFLVVMDGAAHDFYDQFNQIADIPNCVIALVDGVVCGCGAFKLYDGTTAEIKRMYVLPEFRNRGVAAAILNELELWATSSGFTNVILETGIKHIEAIRLYEKSGYKVIPNYPPYTAVENSICMKKQLLNSNTS